MAGTDALAFANSNASYTDDNTDPFCADTDASSLCAATGAFAGADIVVFCHMMYANTNSY